jgi:hypothetical protein
MDLKQHGLLNPGDQEVIFINNFSVEFLKKLDKDPTGAKDVYNRIVRPYMEAQLATVRILDDQIQGCIEQNALLLKSNAVLIDQLKKHGVAMPNFDQVQRDVREELQKERDLNLKRN